MATKKVYEVKKLSIGTRVMSSKGIFILDNSLSQRKLKSLYDMGIKAITVKIIEDGKDING